MDIYLTEVSNSSNRFTLPALPEKIQLKSGAQHQNYDIISIGPVKVPKGVDLNIFNWSGTFFGEKKKKDAFIRQWKAPKDCINILQKWQKAGTVLRLLVTETTINHDVTIQSFDGEESGAFGNYTYTITLVEHKELRIYTTSELKIAAFTPAIQPRPAATGGTYTIVGGDTLWGIAQKKLGKGTRWPEIYNLNKQTIEARAAKSKFKTSNNGHWIFPGTVLTLPAK